MTDAIAYPRNVDELNRIPLDYDTELVFMGAVNDEDRIQLRAGGPILQVLYHHNGGLVLSQPENVALHMEIHPSQEWYIPGGPWGIMRVLTEAARKALPDPPNSREQLMAEV